MRLRVLGEKEIGEALNQQLLEGLRASFPNGPVDFAETRYWHGSAPAWSVILEEGDVIVAHVGIVDRDIRVGEEPMRVAGVQNVYVLPGYRGKGYSDDVMNAFMDEAKRLGHFDHGLLFCYPVLERIYRRCGWETLPGRVVIRVDEDRNEVPIPDCNITMFYPIVSPEFPDGAIHLQGNDW